MKLREGVTASAMISEDDAYRYVLTRDWDDKLPRVAWVMLNPSTADANTDDQTLRRIQTYSTAWGFGGLIVANLYGLRSTDPKVLRGHRDPVGPDNDNVLRGLLANEPWLACTRARRGAAPELGLFVAAWGAGAEPSRAAAFITMASKAGQDLHCLGLTKHGAPLHPCRLSDGLEAIMFRARSCRVCGCTENNACMPVYVGIDRPVPCHWVGMDLCSACAS